MRTISDWKNNIVLVSLDLPRLRFYRYKKGIEEIANGPH